MTTSCCETQLHCCCLGQMLRGPVTAACRGVASVGELMGAAAGLLKESLGRADPPHGSANPHSTGPAELYTLCCALPAENSDVPTLTTTSMEAFNMCERCAQCAQGWPPTTMVSSNQCSCPYSAATKSRLGYTRRGITCIQVVENRPCLVVMMI